MPSSFFNRSPLKLVTPFKYSMGLANMVESGLMETVFYKYTIEGSGILPPGGGEKLPQRHGNTEITDPALRFFAVFSLRSLRFLFLPQRPLSISQSTLRSSADFIQHKILLFVFLNDWSNIKYRSTALHYFENALAC